MRSRAARRSSSAMAPLEAWRAMLPLMVASPALIRSSERSLSRTPNPASEQTWAIPLPICPAPITPTVLISMLILPAAWTSVEGARAGNPPGSLSFLTLLTGFGQLLLKLGEDGEEVADEAVIGHLEDRRLLVLVDRYDHLGILHAGQVLNGPRDPHRDVEIRRHHLAGLTHLPVVGRIARIHRSPRSAHGGAQGVGDRLEIGG